MPEQETDTKGLELLSNEPTLEQRIRLDIFKSFITEDLIKESHSSDVIKQNSTFARFMNSMSIIEFAVQYVLEGQSDDLKDKFSSKADELSLEFDEALKVKESEKAKASLEKAIAGVHSAIDTFKNVISRA